MNRWYPARRLFAILVLLATLLGGIWLQVLRLQALYADHLVRSVAAQRGEVAHWGNIVDRHGTPLAVEVPRYKLVLYPNRVPAGRQQEVKDYIVRLGIAPEDAEAIFAKNMAYYPILQNATPEMADAVRAEAERLREQGGLYWFGIEVLPTRYFPQGPLAAQALGFVNWLTEPSGGVHAFYSDFLRFGRGLRPRRAVRATPPGGGSAFLPSPFRRDLVLTLDVGVQYAAEKILAKAVKHYRARGGAAVVMDPRNGEILALANQPTFDPNRFYTGEYPEESYRNRAVGFAYEPGSVIKSLTFAAAIDAGVVTTRTVLVDEGVFEYEGRKIRNADRTAHGRVTPQDILALSLNVPTAQVAMQLGPDRFYRYFDLFGVGQRTEVDIAGESAGQLRRPGDPNWSPIDVATQSFGQGFLMTPVQLARAVAVLANGGRLVSPHVLRGYFLDDAYYELRPAPGRRVIQETTARTMTKLLTGAVDRLPVPARVAGYRVAGKTGTAQVVGENGAYSEKESNVTFVGYLPAENPQVLIVVYLEKPQDERGRWALNSAYPTFVEMATEAVRLLHIPPAARSQ